MLVIALTIIKCYHLEIKGFRDMIERGRGERDWGKVWEKIKKIDKKMFLSIFGTFIYYFFISLF